MGPTFHHHNLNLCTGTLIWTTVGPAAGTRTAACTRRCRSSRPGRSDRWPTWFGTYTCRASDTCAGRPGSLGHELGDAATYAGWGVDLLKEDSCFTAGDNETLAVEQYTRMRDALNSTGRPIVFALCGWFPWYGHCDIVLGPSRASFPCSVPPCTRRVKCSAGRRW